MPSANVQLIRNVFPPDVDMVELVETIAAGLPREAGALLHPDLEIEFVPYALGGLPKLRGPEGFAAGWREWLEPYSSYVTTMEDMIDVGDDQVLTLVHVRARTQRDGVVVEHRPAAVSTIRDGRIVHVRFYLDRDEALAAVGRDPLER